MYEQSQKDEIIKMLKLPKAMLHGYIFVVIATLFCGMNAKC